MNFKLKTSNFLVKASITILFISTGLLLLYFIQNIIDLILGIFFLSVGTILLLYLIKANKSLDSYSKATNFDERSEINRLKASDLSFKFLFVSINILILVYALNPIPVEIFVAFLSPLLAFSIIIYLGYFYWHEKEMV